MHHRPRFMSIAACTLIVASMLMIPTAANVHQATWNGNDNFHYHILMMPDIDQRWWNLPGEGSMYCAPAAGVNMALYAANHGFSNVYPGPQCWSCPLGFDEINALTNALADMGSDMGTSGSGGTGTNGIRNGLEAYLGNNHLEVYGHYASNSTSPRMEDIAYAAIDGALVMFCFGRYVIAADSGPVVIVDKRNTGHCVTVVRAQRDGAARLLWSRDPGQDESPRDLFDQSLFTNRVYNPISEHVIVRLDPFFVRTMTALEHPSSDNRIRLIDKFYRVRPSFGYSFTPLLVQLHIPNGSFVQQPNPIPVPFPIDPLEPGFGIVDAAEHPWDSSMVFLARSGGVGEVRRLDGLSGETMLLGTFSNPTHIAVGRRGDIFVLAGNQLHRREAQAFDDEAPAWTTMSLMNHDGAPIFADAIAYDDARDETVLVSSAQRVVMRIRWSYMGEASQPSIVELPAAVPVAGNVRLAVDVRDHKAWFVSDASTIMFGIGLEPPPGEQLDWTVFGHPAMPDPRSISIAPGGRLYTTVPDVGDEVIVAMVPGPDDRWIPDPSSTFNGLRVGTGFKIAFGRSNFDPELHEGPEWLNVDPDEELLVIEGLHVPDCYADITADYHVDISDLLILLSEWGMPRSVADLNHDGTVDVSDLLILLTHWGPCPG